MAVLSLPLWGYPAGLTLAAQVLAEAGIPIVEDAAPGRHRAAPPASSLPADGMLRELTLANGDTPNYYCLVLRASQAVAPQIAAALTRRGLSPDTIRWRYQGLHHRPMFAQWASPCPHADALIATTFQIPVHPGLDPAALRYITEAVRAASEGNDQ